MASKTLFLALCLAVFAIEAHGFKSFIAYRRPINFFTAWQTCRLYGGHLASIESDEENAGVEAAIRAVGNINGNWFIGGTDVGYEGRFVWIGLNKEITSTSYKNWAAGEPNDYKGAEDCMAMGSVAGNKWNDVGCNITVDGYVCAYVD